MGVKDGFMGASLLLKVALVLIVLSNMVSWIAFTTTSWAYVDNDKGTTNHGLGVGIWKFCGLMGCSAQTDGIREVWFGSFQAFAIFGFVGINVVCLLVVLALFVDACKGNGEVKMAAAIIAFITAVCYLIAVIIFAVNWDDDEDGVPTIGADKDGKFGFSFALAIIALVLEVVVGVLMIVDGKGGGTSPA